MHAHIDRSSRHTPAKRFPDFFFSFWNNFDALIVIVSYVSYFEKGVPAFAPLRVIRVFRAIKLLRRVKSLHKIIAALSVSILPVCNSFVLFGFVTMIYGTVGVQIFRNAPSTEGYFDGFFQASFTMFQVLIPEHGVSTPSDPQTFHAKPETRNPTPFTRHLVSEIQHPSLDTLHSTPGVE